MRQGCPLPPYSFILCADILGNTVRKDNEVHGIKIFHSECKSSQYADDTTMILDGSKSSFLRSLYLLDAFASISGLKVNYKKKLKPSRLAPLKVLILFSPQVNQ